MQHGASSIASRYPAFPCFSLETGYIVCTCTHKGSGTCEKRSASRAIDALRVGEIIADNNPVGFVARRLKSGAVTYGYQYRDKASGKQRWIGLGMHGDLTPDQARKKALKVAGEVKDGGEPVSAAAVAAKRRQAAGYTVDALLDNFLDRYARPNLRSADEIERMFPCLCAAEDRQQVDLRSQAARHRRTARRDRGRRRAGDGRPDAGAPAPGVKLARHPR